jgi:hypothetical protein
LRFPHDDPIAFTRSLYVSTSRLNVYSPSSRGCPLVWSDGAAINTWATPSLPAMNASSFPLSNPVVKLGLAGYTPSMTLSYNRHEDIHSRQSTTYVRWVDRC